MKTRLLGVIGSVLLASVAVGQVSLEFKQAENESYKSSAEIRVAQVLSIAGQELNTSNTQVLETSTAHGVRLPDGTLRAKTSIDKWTAKMTFPGGIAMEFDSAVPDKKAPIAQLEPVLEMMRTLLKTPVTLVYSKDGMIKAVELPAGATAGLPKQLAGDLDPKKLVAQHKDQQLILPDKAISKGDTWTRDHEANLGAGQMLKMRVDYKYEGRVKRKGRELDHITGTVTRTEYANAGKAPGPLQVKASELKPVKSVYEVYFDAKLGRFVDVKTSVQLKGDLTLEINGMDLPGKLDLTIGNHTVELPKKD